MKVLHVVEAIEGGIGRHVADLVRHVDAEHLVVMPAERVGGFTDAEAQRALADAGAAIQIVPMRRSVADPRNPLATLRVRRLIGAWRPEIVHGHSSIGGVAARLGSIGTDVARVYTPNGLPPGRGARAIERMLGRLTDAFVAVSDSEAALATELGIAGPDRIVVVPNGIDIEAHEAPVLDLREELGIDEATPLVGTIARLAPQKAPEVFVRACALVAASVPQARFVHIGDGPLINLVMREVSEAGLEPRWRLFRGLAGAASLLPAMNVFALASRFEGGPYAPLEAMRAGTPVVVSDVVGNRDTVEDGRSGLVVPPDDPVALANAITSLLKDPERAREIGRLGRRRVEEYFDVRITAPRLTDVYRSVGRRRP